MAKLEKSLFIVEQLSGGRRLSLKEINERFERSSLYDKEILARSFARYKEFILMNWGIIIDYDFSSGEYYIENEQYSDTTELYKYLLTSIRVSNLTAEIMRNRNRVHFSQVSTGVDNLYPILIAIEQHKTVEFDYASFTTRERKHHDRFPCFVQEWEGRWYLVAEHQNHKTPTVFALERMVNVTVGKVDGEPKAGIDPDEYFFGSFGVNHNLEQPVEEVRVRFYDSQVEYVRAKPLHPSQQETSSGDCWAEFTYHLSLCFNFYQQILWHREKAEIVFPEKAREEIREIVKKITLRY